MYKYIFFIQLWTVTAFAQGPLSLIPLSSVTHTAIQSGEWGNPDTWGGSLPGDDATLHIPPGVVVTISEQFEQRYASLLLEGTLKFANDVSTSLYIETIVGSMQSIIEIGTKSQPIEPDVSAGIVFIDRGPIDLNADFQQFGKGLIMMGKTDVCGAFKTSWMTLASAPSMGDATVTLAAQPVGWEPGDEIVITGTQLGNPESDEKRTIVAVTGKTLTLNTPLAWDHHPPQGTDFHVHIANLSRNVVFQSENPDIPRRAHVMFMHNLDVRLENMRFYQMGRTNKRVQVDDWFFPTLVADVYEAGDRTNIRGRYSCHFHRGGVNPHTTTPALVKGCVIEDDPGWAYVNHSSNVDFINNVSYNIVGGAFQTESGDEIGSFRNNLAIRTVNPDYPLLDPETAPVDIRESSQDFAFQGDGFWFHGGGVEVEGNVASGSSGHGFIYWTEGQREVGTPFDLQNMFLVSNIPNGDLLPNLDMIQSWWVPLASFKNNIAYCSTNGFAGYYMHATLFEDFTELTDAYVSTLGSLIEDFTVWNSSKFGIELHNCERLTFSNLTLINDASQPDDRIGIMNQITVANRTNWLNCTVKGFTTGMVPPMQGEVHICGGAFTNETDLMLVPPQRDSRVPGNARDLRIEGVNFGTDAQIFAPRGETPIMMAGREALEGEVPFIEYEFQQRFFMIPDRIMVDLPGLPDRRLYYEQQEAQYTPITSDNIGDATGAYRSLIENATNQELFDQTGLAFAGSLLPEQYTTDSRIVGGVVSTTDLPMNIPACQYIQQPLLPANAYDDFNFGECWENLNEFSDGVFAEAAHPSCSIRNCVDNHVVITDTIAALYSILSVADSIILESVIPSNTVHQFQAGQLIRLEPPFHATHGAEVSFVINDCPDPQEFSGLQEENSSSGTQILSTSPTKPGLEIYPNPARGKFNLRLSLAEAELCNLTLTGTTGQLLWNKRYQFAEGQNILELYIEHVPAGTYYVSIHSSSGIVTSPLHVIQ